jgi:hypothetical protein
MTAKTKQTKQKQDIGHVDCLIMQNNSVYQVEETFSGKTYIPIS